MCYHGDITTISNCPRPASGKSVFGASRVSLPAVVKASSSFSSFSQKPFLQPHCYQKQAIQPNTASLLFSKVFSKIYLLVFCSINTAVALAVLLCKHFEKWPHERKEKMPAWFFLPFRPILLYFLLLVGIFC